MVRRHCAADMEATEASTGGQMPWLATRMSKSPKAARVAATRDSPSSGVANGWRMGRQTVGPPQFFGQGFGLGLGGDVAEGYAGSGLAEQADGGCTDSAGASGDEGGAAFERESYTGSGVGLHCFILHQVRRWLGRMDCFRRFLPSLRRGRGRLELSRWLPRPPECALAR